MLPVIITGVSPKGIGAEAARVFAKTGAKVVLAGRSQSKYVELQYCVTVCFRLTILHNHRIQETAEAIKKETPDANLRELVLDLGSQKSVRKAADEVLSYPDPVDALILNAGVVRISQFLHSEEVHLTPYR